MSQWAFRYLFDTSVNVNVDTIGTPKHGELPTTPIFQGLIHLEPTLKIHLPQHVLGEDELDEKTLVQTPSKTNDTPDDWLLNMRESSPRPNLDFQLTRLVVFNLMRQYILFGRAHQSMILLDVSLPKLISRLFLQPMNNEQVEQLASLSANLANLKIMFGHKAEGRLWANKTLELTHLHPSQPQNLLIRAWMAMLLGDLEKSEGHLEDAKQQYQQAKQLGMEIHLDPIVQQAENNLANLENDKVLQ
jgi:hypothetical protein